LVTRKRIPEYISQEEVTSAFAFTWLARMRVASKEWFKRLPVFRSIPEKTNFVVGALLCVERAAPDWS
jgi:hypothetical protein